jgi:hypothetical protein
MIVDDLFKMAVVYSCVGLLTGYTFLELLILEGFLAKK